MTQTAQDKKPTERTPIRVAKIIITHPNPHGIAMPDGVNGDGEKQLSRLIAGIEAGKRTEIDFLPWMRAFRVKKSLRVTHTDNGKEVANWKPMGKPFYISEMWATWIPVEE
jgi:hypothetical protein